MKTLLTVALASLLLAACGQSAACDLDPVDCAYSEHSPAQGGNVVTDCTVDNTEGVTCPGTDAGNYGTCCNHVCLGVAQCP
jgi:hypothetical protein